MGGFKDMIGSVQSVQGQRDAAMGKGVGKMIMAPAYVVDTNDPFNEGRIKARLVDVDDNGNITGKKSDLVENTNGFGGKDKELKDEQLPMCFPIMPRFFHVRPKKGEMVMLFFENPEDSSSPRHYIGPLISTDVDLSKQNFEKSLKTYEMTVFASTAPSKQTTSNNPIFTIDESDVALKGRGDADLILKNREAILTCSRFSVLDKYKPNKESFSYVRIKNYVKTDENIKKIKSALSDSNINILKEHSMNETNSSVLCLYSPLGKFRGDDIKKFEKNNLLPSFTVFENSESGVNLADTLHPGVFGDELIRLLDIIIRVLLNHTHTPQNPLLSEALSAELGKYTVDGLLQNIISNIIRIN